MFRRRTHRNPDGRAATTAATAEDAAAGPTSAPLGSPDGHGPWPEVAEASRHIARVLRRDALVAIGLCPTSDDVAVLPAAVQIGVALSEQSGAPVALFDVNARWSALPGGPPGARGGAEADAALQGPILRSRWIAGDRLSILSLPEGATIGTGLVEMERLLRSGRSMFEHVLVDLTGLERLGEHLAAANMCDALVFVARAGSTRESDLDRLRHAFASHRTLGVILTGSP